MDIKQSLCLFFSSRLTFTNPDKDDLGRYSVVVTDTDGVSASHTLTEDSTSCSTQTIHSKQNSDSYSPASYKLLLFFIFVFSNLFCSTEHHAGAQLCHQTSR